MAGSGCFVRGRSVPSALGRSDGAEGPFGLLWAALTEMRRCAGVRLKQLVLRAGVRLSWFCAPPPSGLTELRLSCWQSVRGNFPREVGGFPWNRGGHGIGWKERWSCGPSVHRHLSMRSGLERHRQE